MGYYAIIHDNLDILYNLTIVKTSETVFLHKRSSYNILEVEIGITKKEVMNEKNISFEKSISLDIIFHGQVINLEARNDLVSSSEFIHWYYSSADYCDIGERKIVFKKDYSTYLINSKLTCEEFRDKNNSPKATVIIDNKDIPADATSLTVFMSYRNKGNVSKHFGNLYAESRYFDRKIFGKDTRQNDYKSSKFLIPERIYSWFIIPRHYVASDYTDSEEFKIRDLHLLEPQYHTMFKGMSIISRIIISFANKFIGKPQVLNWCIDVKNRNSKNNSSVDYLNDIRLFVTCTSHFSVYFISITSLIGFFITIISLLIAK